MGFVLDYRHYRLFCHVFFRWSASAWWLLLLSFVIRTYNLEEFYCRHFTVPARKHVIVYNYVCYLVIYRSQRAKLQLCLTYCRQSKT